jgi:putative ABC transport system ATP-binding protein
MFLETTALTINRRGAIISLPALSLAPGARVMLRGPSGCGKTTWLSVIGGLLPPDEGTITADGIDIYKMPGRKRDHWRGRQCGFVFQTMHLIPSLTVRQNIALAASLSGLPVDNTRIDALLEKLQIAAKAHKKPASLSQGEQQRAAVARAVLNRPPLILADEPTSALDDAHAQSVIDILIDCAAENNSALLVATHDNRIASRFDRSVDITPDQRISA